MTTNGPAWYSRSMPGTTLLICCVCRKEIDLKFPSLDHHPASCPACGVVSIFLSWKDVLLQIVPGEAPPELARAIRWSQENLDELEFFTLLSSVAEIGATVQAEIGLMQ
jgi:hypothetical protein